MTTDKYTDTLNEMITLFKNYKPGIVTLDNITKLCQTLGLESFIDDVDNEVARLSTASKIIVIDIDFIKSEGKVKDVELVLASNFDNFNYFENKNPLESGLQSQDKESNILLKSLIEYPNLNEFHENLEFLYLLDSYSQLDVDSNNSVHGSGGLHGSGNNHSDSNNNNTTTGNLSNGANNSPIGSNNTKNANGNNNNNNNSSSNNQLEKNKLDLFKYYTELSQYIQDYLLDRGIKWNVATNLDSKFGIYIITADTEREIVAKITFKKSLDPQHILYEYIYSKDTKEWINESAESYTMGVSLVMEIISDSIWFPKSFISTDVIFDNNTQTNGLIRTNINKSNSRQRDDNINNYNSTKFLKLLTNLEDGSHPPSGNGLYYHDKIRLINDFTSPLIRLPFFDISNDNIDLIDEILTWTLWSKRVLENIVELMMVQKESTSTYDDDHKLLLAPNGNIRSSVDTSTNTTLGFNSIDHYRHNSVSGANVTPDIGMRRRRSSNKGKRPSITEATMFKDEGLQQFNLHDVMSEQHSVITEEDDDDYNTTQGHNNEHMSTDDNGHSNNDGPDTSKDVPVMEDDSRMDIDPMELGNDIEDTRDIKEEQEQETTVQELIPLIICEDHISLGDIASCNLYEPVSKWDAFMSSFRQTI